MANTATSVATSGTPTVTGQPVIFTATVSVTAPGSTAVAAPTGTVTFYDSGTAIGTGTLAVSAGVDQASYTSYTLGTGSHTITAAYTSSDGNFNASPTSSPITQVVTPLFSANLRLWHGNLASPGGLYPGDGENEIHKRAGVWLAKRDDRQPRPGDWIEHGS